MRGTGVSEGGEGGGGEGMGFIDVFSCRATGFHRQAKLFELNFFVR